MGVLLAILGMMLQPVDRGNDKEIGYYLNAGTSVADLAQDLKSDGLIRSQKAFTVYVTITGQRRNLQAGNYLLKPSQSSMDIARMLSTGRVAQNTLVVPEGYTLKQIERGMIEKGISATDFQNALTQPYESALLAERPTGNSSLEGYLFPDSYELTKPANAEKAIQAMLDNLEEKLEAEKVKEGFAAQGLTLHQGLTLASIVEAEAGSDDQRGPIAQVFLKRLGQNGLLQSDPTIDYGASLLGTQFNLQLNSPYNTYLHRGLPPGPICNPGMQSIKAVINPAKTDYMYFLHDKGGNIHYSKTLQEHEAKVQKYLR